MCKVMVDNGGFDPALCPLLQDLSPEEIAERLKEPRFQACVTRFGGNGPAEPVAPPCESAPGRGRQAA